MSVTDEPRDTGCENGQRGVSEMRVKDVADGSDASKRVSVTGDCREYIVTFDRADGSGLELTAGERVEAPNDTRALQRATMVAVRHLRRVEGTEIRLASLPTEPKDPLSVRDDAYFYGGCNTVHLYAGVESTSLCDEAVMTGDRKRLGVREEPVSEIDGLCPKCARELKLLGHYEAYENPDSF